MTRTILLYAPTIKNYIEHSEKSRFEAMDEYAQYEQYLNYMVKELNDSLDILNAYYNASYNVNGDNFQVKLINYLSGEKLDETEEAFRMCICFKGMYRNDKLATLFAKIVKKTSHLVCLVIDEAIETFSWEQKTQNPFDAIINVNTKSIKYVIMSVCYDIILYNCFHLPKGLEYRKKFSSIKNAFINSEYGTSFIEETYNASTVDRDVYLPISLATIMEISSTETDIINFAKEIKEKNREENLRKIYSKLIRIEFFKKNDEGIYTYFLQDIHIDKIKQHVKEASMKISDGGDKMFCLLRPDCKDQNIPFPDFFATELQTVSSCPTSILTQKFFSVVHLLPNFVFFDTKGGNSSWATNGLHS